MNPADLVYRRTRCPHLCGSREAPSTAMTLGRSSDSSVVGHVYLFRLVLDGGVIGRPGVRSVAAAARAPR